MASQQINFVSKTEHYLKVKKPMIERQRRARINKCLDSLKELVAELLGNDAILRMDKAEMLESALTFVKTQTKKNVSTPAQIPMDSFRNGYMNAVNEVSRVMAATPGMNVNVGKAVMSHLGQEYNRLLTVQPTTAETLQHCSSAPMSPASSGYHSDDCEDTCSPMSSPAQKQSVWRPW